MNTRKTIEPYKEEIINAINEVESFIVGMDMVSFIKDIKTYKATVMCLILIGELASN